MARLAVAEELAGIGSWVFDLQARTALWSEGMYRILGLPPGDELYGMAEVFDRVHPEDRERMQQLLADVVARPEAVPHAGIKHAVRMVRADGSVRELRALGKVDRDDTGRTYWLGSVQDVTEYRSAIGLEPGRFPSGRRAEPGPRPLSTREIEVLRLAADGYNGRGIAEELGISPHTVRAHLANVYEKLGVTDRAAAVAKALRLGLIQ